MDENPYESPHEVTDSAKKRVVSKWIPHVLLWVGGIALSLVCGGPIDLIMIGVGTIREAEREKERAAIRQCPQCDRELANSSRICPRCGHRFDTGA